MPRNRTYFDPALLPEAKMERMRTEMYILRRTIIDLIPEKFRAIVDPPYDLPREGSHQWQRGTAELVIDLTTPGSNGRAPCPLCGKAPQVAGIGFSYPLGLERHLLGTHNSQTCPVMHAANGLRRVRHRELYPDDYGPYGCD
ncbi:hypothetical protein [Lysobacter tyrosinilyticus]